MSSLDNLFLSNNHPGPSQSMEPLRKNQQSLRSQSSFNIPDAQPKIEDTSSVSQILTHKFQLTHMTIPCFLVFFS